MCSFKWGSRITWPSLRSGHFLERKLQAVKGHDFPYILLKFSTYFQLLAITFKLGHKQDMPMNRHWRTCDVSSYYLLHIRGNWNFQLGIYHVPNAGQAIWVSRALVYVDDYMPCKFRRCTLKRVEAIPCAHLSEFAICSFKLQRVTILFTMTTTEQVIYSVHVYVIANLRHVSDCDQCLCPVTAHGFKIREESVTHLVTRYNSA